MQLGLVRATLASARLQAKPQFAALGGTIGVTVEQHGPVPPTWRYRITQGEVAPAVTLPEATHAAQGYDPFGATKLAQIERIGSAYVRGAQLVSPNRPLNVAEAV